MLIRNYRRGTIPAHPGDGPGGPTVQLESFEIWLWCDGPVTPAHATLVGCALLVDADPDPDRPLAVACVDRRGSGPWTAYFRTVLGLTGAWANHSRPEPTGLVLSNQVGGAMVVEAPDAAAAAEAIVARLDGFRGTPSRPDPDAIEALINLTVASLATADHSSASGAQGMFDALRDEADDLIIGGNLDVDVEAALLAFVEVLDEGIHDAGETIGAGLDGDPTDRQEKAVEAGEIPKTVEDLLADVEAAVADVSAALKGEL